MFCGEGDPPNTPYGHAQNPPGSAFDDWCGENRFDPFLLNFESKVDRSPHSQQEYLMHLFSASASTCKLPSHYSGGYSMCRRVVQPQEAWHCCLVRFDKNLLRRRKDHHPADDQTAYFQTTLLCAVRLVLAALVRTPNNTGPQISYSFQALPPRRFKLDYAIIFSSSAWHPCPTHANSHNLCCCLETRTVDVLSWSTPSTWSLIRPLPSSPSAETSTGHRTSLPWNFTTSVFGFGGKEAVHRSV